MVVRVHEGFNISVKFGLELFLLLFTELALDVGCSNSLVDENIFQHHVAIFAEPDPNLHAL